MQPDTTVSDGSADATLIASRALLGVIARSVSEALEVVTLPQFRILVVLHARGPLRFGVLADRMRINPSTFSRSIDRMVAGGWVERSQSPESRREVLIVLSQHGRGLVDHVMLRRRNELERILSPLEPAQREEIQRALRLFAEAAGEPPAEDLLTLGV